MQNVTNATGNDLATMTTLDDQEEQPDEWTDVDDDQPTIDDPFEGLRQRDQDIFFRVLDMVPESQREATMEYFLSHPEKIRGVVMDVKKKKDLLDQKKLDELYKIFEQEKILLQKFSPSSLSPT